MAAVTWGRFEVRCLMFAVFVTDSFLGIKTFGFFIACCPLSIAHCPLFLPVAPELFGTDFVLVSVEKCVV